MDLIREQKYISKEYRSIVNKEAEYLDYINEHKVNVIKAYNNLFIDRVLPLSTPTISSREFEIAIASIANDIKEHDQSKYTDEEFYAYRKKFYPTNKEKKDMDDDPTYALMVEQEFLEAWKHHFTTNDHHPKHWKVINGEFNESNDPTDMSLGAIIHAICDWQAMSYKFNSDILEWYEKADDEKSYMSPRTREMFDEIMKELFVK